MKKGLAFLSVLAIFGVLAACTSTGTAFNPPGGGILAAHHMVVSDVANNSVLTFPLSAGAATAPTATLSGSSTQLNQPEGIFVDSLHRTLWVGNYSSGSNGTVTEYALSGATTPMKSIGGMLTTIKGPGGIYVDGSGNLYVADYQNAAIDVFSSSASGNVAPARQIIGSSTLLTSAAGLWLDNAGHIWVGSSSGVHEFAANANGNVAPINSLTLPASAAPMGVFVDRAQNIWVADAENSSVYEYAAGATSATPPERTISGALTTLREPNGVYVDGAGKIYIADYSAAAVLVFAANATGNIAPVQTIPANGTTTLGKPIGVVVY